MKILIITLVILSLCGCSTTTKNTAGVSHPKLVDLDINLAQQFLDALLRPTFTNYKVIVDTQSEISPKGIPEQTLKKELTNRLVKLRRSPKDVISINISSTNHPAPWGSGLYRYSYNTKSGELKELGLDQSGIDDLSISISRWKNDEGVITVGSYPWINDLKHSTFDFSSGRNTFRLAVAIEPLIH